MISDSDIFTASATNATAHEAELRHHRSKAAATSRQLRNARFFTSYSCAIGADHTAPIPSGTLPRGGTRPPSGCLSTLTPGERHCSCVIPRGASSASSLAAAAAAARVHLSSRGVTSGSPPPPREAGECSWPRESRHAFPIQTARASEWCQR